MKKLGCSWIELCDMAHCFLMADQSHLELFNIISRNIVGCFLQQSAKFLVIMYQDSRQSAWSNCHPNIEYGESVLDLLLVVEMEG